LGLGLADRIELKIRNCERKNGNTGGIYQNLLTKKMTLKATPSNIDESE
jgi:hypothetical protein